MVLSTTERSLSGEITHYEVLLYNSTDILKQCEQYWSPNSASQSKPFISLSFIAMERYICFISCRQLTVLLCIDDGTAISALSIVQKY